MTRLGLNGVLSSGRVLPKRRRGRLCLKAQQQLIKWWDASLRLPQFTYLLLHQSAPPRLVQRLVTTALQEGNEALAGKVIGDSLADLLQNSGPVFTKIGQILSVRNDLVPLSISSRLEKLYSQQPSMPQREVRRILRKAYGRSYPFKKFDFEALAVGSVGEVYRAFLKDGTPVVVKLIRPGMEKAIRKDIHFLQCLLEVFFLFTFGKRKSLHFMLEKTLTDLKTEFLKEIDLSLEKKALLRFAKRMKKNKAIQVPKVYEMYCKKNVLVMEFLEGTPLHEYQKRHPRKSKELKAIASEVLKEILTQVFDDGHFHADPHPGNLLVLEGGRIGLIDLGLTGEFGRQERKKLASAVRAFLSRDKEGVIRSLLQFGELPPKFNFEKFEKDIVDVVKKYQGKTVKRLKGAETDPSEGLEEFVQKLFEVAHRHRVFVPSSSTLLIKTLVTIEGVARRLDPEMNLALTALPIVIRSLTPKWMRFLNPFQ